MKRIIINGRGTSGKDEFVKIFSELYPCSTHNISSIDPIKEIARESGWNGEKDEKSRKMLADLKQIFINYNDLPTQYLYDHCVHLKMIDPFYNESVIFMHIREPNEISKLKQIFHLEDKEVTTLLIDKNIGNLGNSADDDVMDYKYDYYIDNNGTLEQLRESVKTFINEEL